LQLELADSGILEKYNVELIARSSERSRKLRPAALQRRDAEDRVDVPKVHAHQHLKTGSTSPEIGFPVIIRPSFTLADRRGGIAYNAKRCWRSLAGRADLSPVHQV